MLLVKASRNRPKDGDTKPATGKQGGTLVFSKGRWRRKDAPGNLRPKGSLKIVGEDAPSKLKPKARQGKQWGAGKVKPDAPVEQASQLRFTRWGQKKDEPGADDDEEITLEWLEASDAMLAESLAKFGDPLKRAMIEPPMSFENALNNIVPTDSTQTELVGELREDLLNLQAMARDFAIEARGRDRAKSAEDMAAEAAKAMAGQIAELNRIYKGKVSQDEAQNLALSTRMFHTLHPRKMIRVPKGTTQREYADIVEKLMDDDKQAIKQYTVPRPSKKSKKKSNLKPKSAPAPIDITSVSDYDEGAGSKKGKKMKTSSAQTRFATIRQSPSGQPVYIISWDASGNRLGRNIQNRSVTKEKFESFVKKHGLTVDDAR
jgi:hypothetical protein